MVKYFRNACIALSVAAATAPAFAEDSGMATAAKAALDTAQADVSGTAPKVMAVVAIVAGVGVLIALLRKI